MTIEDLTVRDYIQVFGSTAGGRVLRWQFAAKYSDRLVILEEALQQCYSNLVDTRGLDEDRGEDELSMQIVNMLTMSGIPAQHDRHINGHCDIVVDNYSGFMWLGEAKIHKDYGWLDDGFLQLSSRYGTAMEGRNHGELIIYHRAGKSKSVLTEWRDRLLKQHEDVKLTEDIADPKLYFRTKHTCPNSGCDYYVRHSIVPLLHDPKK